MVRMKDRWKGWSCFLTCWLLVSGIVECGGSDVADADADVDADVADFNTTTTTTSARTANLSDMTTSHAATSLASTASTARRTTNEGKPDLTGVI